MLILVFVVSFGPKKGTLLTYDSFWRYPFYEYLKGVKIGVEHFILTRLQTSFNLTDTRFLTFIFQNNTVGSKQIYYNQLPLNFYKIYVDKPLYVSLGANSLLGTKTFYPTNSLVEQTFTQDLTLYLLLLNR